MNPEIKARWVEKLRSGVIPQLEGYLGNTTGARCCLGVLCDIAVEDGIIPDPCVDGDLLVYGDGRGNNCSLLPSSVTSWAGLIVRDSFDPTPEDYAAWLADANYKGAGTKYLTQLNDAGVSFPCIADTIERHF